MHWLLALMALGVHLSLGVASRSVTDAHHCAVELETLRFVTSPKGEMLPLYWDLDLAAHLTQAYRRTHQQDPAGGAETVVIPLYSAESMMFRRGAHLFVTTGMLARINDDAELANPFRELPLLARGRRRREVRKPSSCERMLAAGLVVSEFVWSSLHESLLRYEEWTRPRLRVRAESRGEGVVPPQP